MGKRLYIGNLSPEVTEHDILYAAQEHGGVLDVAIITDPASGKSKGYGFIGVEDRDASNLVSALNGREIRGQAILVREEEKPH